jgi:hypothetical protein
MVGLTIQTLSAGVGFAVAKSEGSLCNKRHRLAQRAVNEGFSHVFFVDTDQTFPGDTILRLLEHRKPFVACNIATKTATASPTARKFNREEEGRWKRGEVLYTLPDSTGLERVFRIGTGIVLIESDVFRQIKPPWFLETWKEGYNEYQGEDWYLCEKCQEYKIPMFIDHDLSKHVGHVGKFEYNVETTWAGLHHVAQYGEPPEEGARCR